MMPRDDQTPIGTTEADSAAGVSCAEPAGSVGWTASRPKAEGFYWYREAGSQPVVIFWDDDMQWVLTAGNEIAWGDDMTCKIEGEFWPEKLTPPNAEAVATASETHPQTQQTTFEPLPPAHGSAPNEHRL